PLTLSKSLSGSALGPASQPASRDRPPAAPRYPRHDTANRESASTTYDAAVLVWMDLEMTGLDPTRHVIVEIATLVTDDQLAVVEEGPDLVVSAPREAVAAMVEPVRSMHERSGLRAQIEASSVTLEDAGARTL